MAELIGLIAGALAVIGVLMNNRLVRHCFLLWMVSNLLSAGLHVSVGLWSLTARDIVFFVLAVEGWLMWGGRRSVGGGRN